MKLVTKIILSFIVAAILGGCGPTQIIYEGPTPTKDVTLRLEDKTCS